MMASLQQAISKGMPPDQAIQYVKGMATQGVAPLTDLYSMMNQFQRLKQQQVKPPQTPPTIKDQLNMLDQQQQMQPQQGNIQQMQAGAPAPQPMDRGLGAIDAGRMEYPQFAGGGIVAFEDGGTVRMANGTPPSVFETSGAPVSIFTDISEGEFLSDSEEQELGKLLELRRNVFSSPFVDPSSLDLLKRSEGRYKELIAKREASKRKDIESRQAAGVAAEAQRRGITLPATPAPPAAGAGTKPPATGGQRPSGGVQLGGGDYGDFGRGRKILSDIETQLKPEAEKTLEQRLAEIDAIQAKQGIGEASRKQGEYLTKREAEAAKDLAGDKRMALAQAGFAMAEAASRRGRERTGFLGAAAIGGTTGTKLYQAALKENRALKDSIAQNRFALEQANELRKTGNIRDANALEKEAKSNLRSLNLARAQNETAIAEFQGRERGADRRLGAQLGAQEKRYAQAAQIAQSKLMQGVLEQAPILIPGFGKLSVDEQAAALQKLLGALAGGSGAMTGLGTIEGIEEE
jgi:hypothetical protein